MLGEIKHLSLLCQPRGVKGGRDVFLRSEGVIRYPTWSRHRDGVLGEVGRKRADEIILDLSQLIPRYLGGTLLSAVVTSEKPSVEFQI